MRHKPKRSARLAYWKREAKLNAIFYASESAQVTELLNIIENLKSEIKNTKRSLTKSFENAMKLCSYQTDALLDIIRDLRKENEELRQELDSLSLKQHILSQELHHGDGEQEHKYDPAGPTYGGDTLGGLK